VPPLDLKGKSQPVTAFQLLAVGDAAPRRLYRALVGRERELRGLEDAFARVVHHRACQLFTILGPAGVGKSRLAAEFLERVDAQVVHGRCVSYGEGITYGPVIELVKQLGPPTSDDFGAPLRSLLGESDEATSADEIAWAFRKLLEQRARDTPIVCVLDDVHWGEEKFLDLVENVTDLVRDAPILVLCMARPELLDRRAGWGGGKLNSTTVLLEPLDPTETDLLLDALGAAEGELRERIATAAEGNPLFLEEMVALVRESGGGEVVVPPTIQALLAARLDLLEPAERNVLERGSVEGRVFHRSAVEALNGVESQLPARLVSLVRKELVRLEPVSRLPGDEAYRFRHLLIRDAAYEALPKAVRAELHERFAAWLEARAPDLGDVDEVVGYHLEQAAGYKAELRQPDPSLAARAGERIAAAGRLALWRGDDVAAAALLERAARLLRPTRVDVALELDLASVQPTPPEAAAIADAAAEAALAAGDRPGEAAARAVATFNRVLSGEATFDELDERCREALPLLEEAGDHACLVHIWSALGFGVANGRGRYAEWSHAAEQAFRHSRLAGQRPTHVFYLDMTLILGPTPADEALRKLDAVLSEVDHPHPLLGRSQLLAMLGRFDEAWSSALEASERLKELAPALNDAQFTLSEIASRQGDYEAAAEHLVVFCDFLEAHGQRAILSTFAGMLGRVLCVLGRFDEAEARAQLGRELGEEHDVATQSLWRQVQALVDSQRGRHAEAEALAREAVALVEHTDALNFQGAAHHDLAEVLLAAGSVDAATASFGEALERYERKANVAASAQLRARLAALPEVTQSL
jgi:tetratricopeptide (TPR) repeat protein